MGARCMHISLRAPLQGYWRSKRSVSAKKDFFCGTRLRGWVWASRRLAQEQSLTVRWCGYMHHTARAHQLQHSTNERAGDSDRV